MSDYISTYQHKIGESVTGDDIAIQVIRVKGADSHTPSVYIQTGIHGAELQGNAVIYYLLEYLKKHQPLGNITIVPHCNPLGENLKMGEYTFGRFDPITGENWNRVYFHQSNVVPEFIATLNDKLSLTDIYTQFRNFLISRLQAVSSTTWGLSRAQAIGYCLQLLALQADIVLDLHAANYSIEHIYVPTYAKEQAKYFNIQQCILMNNQFVHALDEASFCPWWELVMALQKIGYTITTVPVEAYTVELGHQEKIDLALAKQQANKILNYLMHKNVIAGKAKLSKANYFFCSTADYKVLYAPYGGCYEFAVSPGEAITEGQLLCHCLTQNEIKAIYAPENGYLILYFSSASIPKGAELAKFSTNINSIVSK